MPRQEQRAGPVCDIRPEWRPKCMSTMIFFWQRLSEKIGSFEELTVLIVQLNELGRVSLQ